METHCKIWVGVCLLLAACLAWNAAPSGAGDKKKDDQKKAEKKKAPPAGPPPVFSKADELKDADEKDTHPRTKESRRKVYPLTLGEGKVYQIDLKSKDFDSVLRLEDSAKTQVAFNDDMGAASQDSRILYAPTKAGEFKIIATSLSPKTGKFTLTVNELPAGSRVSPFKVKAIALKHKNSKITHASELNVNDAQTNGRYYKLFTIPLEAGKTIRIDHRSADFDAYLFLEDPLGNPIAENDDADGSVNSRIQFKSPAAGVYRVIATSLTARSTGKFTLEVDPDGAP